MWTWVESCLGVWTFSLSTSMCFPFPKPFQTKKMDEKTSCKHFVVQLPLFWCSFFCLLFFLEVIRTSSPGAWSRNLLHRTRWDLQGPFGTRCGVSGWRVLGVGRFFLSYRKLTYPRKNGMFEEDFPNFPRWDMLISWRGTNIPLTWRWTQTEVLRSWRGH